MAPSDQQLPRAGDIIAGKYQVESMLGSGGMGAVFKVNHCVTGKSFAIKWLLPDLCTSDETIERFIREAKVAGRVDHPNVVEVYDVGQDGASFYLLMELLHGEPLSLRIEAGALPPAAACRILIPVARGLAAAHRASIIHRDLKPDNIFLCQGATGEELPKLLDFGISKMSPLDRELDAAITRDGVVMGTPNYMAPEQVRSQSVDARTDVYALGVILYQMLSGTLPFPAEGFTDLLFRIMTEEPRPLAQLAPDVPPALIDIVTRAMAREPEQRFASVVDFGQALEPFAEGMLFAVERMSAASRPSVHSGGPRTPSQRRSASEASPHSSGPRTALASEPQRSDAARLSARTLLATESQMRKAATGQARASIWPWVVSAVAALVIGVSLGQWISQRRTQQAAKPAHFATPRPIAAAQQGAATRGAASANDSRPTQSAVYVPPAPVPVQGRMPTPNDPSTLPASPPPGAPPQNAVAPSSEPRASAPANPVAPTPDPGASQRAVVAAESRRQERARIPAPTQAPAAESGADARSTAERATVDEPDRAPLRRNHVRLREDEF